MFLVKVVKLQDLQEAAADLAGKVGRYIQLKMPSNELRKVLADCYATIGVLQS